MQNELFNPQGYGQAALSQMQTLGGQAVAGAVGGAGEAARLAASRSGNPGAGAGIIDATARNAMKQQSDNALSIAKENADLQQKQQQAGATGMANLGNEQTQAALKALGLEDESINAWTGADKENPWNSVGPTIVTDWATGNVGKK